MKKTNIRIWEIILSIIILVWIILLGILVTKYESLLTDYSFIPVIWLFVFAICLFTSLVFVWIEFSSMKKNEPFTLYRGLLACLFIALPLLFFVLVNQKQSSKIVDSFYSIVVGIGTNYVIDSVFKFIEPEFSGQQKNKLVKEAAYTKILFNIIYISMYLSFIIMENQEQLRRLKLPDKLKTCFFGIPDWIKLIILSLSLFVIIMLAVFVFMGTIKEEIDKKIPNKLEEAKKKLSNEIKQVSDLQKSIYDDNVAEDLNSLKQKMENQLRSLKKFDIEKQCQDCKNP